MQNPSFLHLKNLLSLSEIEAARSQAEFNKLRLKAIENALLYRPYYLPVQHTLPSAAQLAPISETTVEENFDLIVTGAITDGENRDVNFYHLNRQNSIVNYGRETNVRFSLDAIAGKSVAAAGFAGVMNYPTPYHLKAQDYFTLEMYQDTSPGSNEIVTTCFNATRVFKPSNFEAQLTKENRERVLREIKKFEAPETKYSVCKVVFDGSGLAETETPRQDEPYFILGFRATFTDAMIRYGFDAERSFSRDYFPIWALANEPDNARQIWNMLQVPLFVPPREQLYFSLKNTVDNVNFASNGTIEVLRKTV